MTKESMADKTVSILDAYRRFADQLLPEVYLHDLKMAVHFDAYKQTREYILGKDSVKIV